MKNEFDKWNIKKQKLETEEYSEENFPKIGECGWVLMENISYELKWNR